MWCRLNRARRGRRCAPQVSLQKGGGIQSTIVREVINKTRRQQRNYPTRPKINHCISSVFALFPLASSPSASSFRLPPLLASSVDDGAAAGTRAGTFSFFFVLTNPEISFAPDAASAIFAFCVAASAPRRPPIRPWKRDGSRLSTGCCVGSALRSLIYMIVSLLHHMV